MRVPLLVLLLAGCETVQAPSVDPHLTEADLLCPGPVEHIPDDDPGLALYPDGPLEERKIELAFDRREKCGVDGG